MAKVKYRYNSRTLSYDKIELSLRDRLLKAFSFLGSGLVFGVIIYLFAYNYLDSPKEKEFKRENLQLQTQYNLLNKRLDHFSAVLEDVQHRDDNIYRVIFEAEPIPNEIRKAGYGGVNRYKALEGYSNSELIVSTSEKLDQLSKQLYIQSKSFDEVFEMAKKKEEMLASIPAIQPISNKDLSRMASGFGYRTDPHYKVRKFHAGMDFSAPTGTPIYATGDGTILRADRKSSGYGNHVRISHGYGYVTLYAHMSKMNVKVGQKVKRGDIIGFVGNTGKSKGPHCHYEVRKLKKPINPISFYFNDLTPEEYEKMIQMSNLNNQSFD